MTRYEIIMGIAPPSGSARSYAGPSVKIPPIEYVMGVDMSLSQRSETACCICHEKNGCMHVDRIDIVPSGRENYERYRYSQELRPVNGCMTDSDIRDPRQREKVRENLFLSDRVNFSDECRNYPDVINFFQTPAHLRFDASFRFDNSKRSGNRYHFSDRYNNCHIMDALSLAKYLLDQKRMEPPRHIQDLPVRSNNGIAPTHKTSGGRVWY